LALPLAAVLLERDGIARAGIVIVSELEAAPRADLVGRNPERIFIRRRELGISRWRPPLVRLRL